MNLKFILYYYIIFKKNVLGLKIENNESLVKG